MCYFHPKAVCWWGNDKNTPPLLAKGKLFHVLQDVTALSPVPSALTGAEETLHEWHCPDWAERTLQHLAFHLPLFRAWQDVHWISPSAGSQRGYRGQLLAAGAQGPLLPRQGPFQHSSWAVGGGCRQCKCLGEEERAAGSLRGRACWSPSVQEGSSASTDLRVPSRSAHQIVVLLPPSGPPDSHLHEKTS